MNPSECYRYEHYDPRLSWHKASASFANGNCVEVAWRKSSRSGAGNCVEVLARPEADVLVRDSKNPDGPRLVFPPDEWAAFLAAVKAGGFG